MKTTENKFAARTWRVLEIVDTRTIDLDTGKPMPETGDYQNCECCGREIAVHAHVKSTETGETAIIGTECCKRLGKCNGIYAASNKIYWRHPNRVWPSVSAAQRVREEIKSLFARS